MHDGARSSRGLRNVPLDDAGNADPDPEQACGVGARVAQDVRHAGTHMADDPLDVVAVLGQQAVGAGEFGEGEVEELDAHPGLPDVDTDEQPAVRGHAQQRTRTPAVGVDDPRLLKEALGGEFRDDVADGA